MNRISSLLITAFFLSIGVAAQTSPVAPANAKPSQNPPGESAAEKTKEDGPKSASGKVDHAAAYYHYTLAHMYEEQITMYLGKPAKELRPWYSDKELKSGEERKRTDEQKLELAFVLYSNFVR